MQWRVSHTGITWPGPDGKLMPGDVEAAVRDVSELGYMGFETFGSTLLDWEQRPGGFGALLKQHGIQMAGAYCGASWIDPAKTKDDVTGVLKQAKILRSLGGDMIVLQAERIPRGSPYTSGQFKTLADVFSEVGRRCQDLGVRAAIHPHTGTAVETWEDIQTILDLVDTRAVFFAPDTGQIAKGGSDIAKVFETYKDLIKHVHLKDWCGKADYGPDGAEIDHSGYVNYEPVGNGVLPIPKLLEILEGAGYDGWLAVELDGTPRAPRPPREAAAMSRRYLGQILGDRVPWHRVS